MIYVEHEVLMNATDEHFLDLVLQIEHEFFIEMNRQPLEFLQQHEIELDNQIQFEKAWRFGADTKKLH